MNLPSEFFLAARNPPWKVLANHRCGCVTALFELGPLPCWEGRWAAFVHNSLSQSQVNRHSTVLALLCPWEKYAPPLIIFRGNSLYLNVEVTALIYIKG